MALFDLPPVRCSKEQNTATAKKASGAASKRVSGGIQTDNLKLRLHALSAKVKTFHPEYLVTDYMMALDYVHSIADNSYVSLDTETTGLNPINDHIVGISLYGGGYPIYIPFGHVDINGKLLDGQEISRSMVASIIEYCATHFKLVFHNAKFDMRMIHNTFKQDGYITPYWDTYIAANFLNENEAHGLKALWSKYCTKDEQTDTYQELFSGIDFKYVPLNIAAEYAAKDALMTTELFLFQHKFLDGHSPECISQDLVEASDLFMNTEMPLIAIIAAMEDQGVLLDIKYAKELIVKYEQIMVETELKCNATIKQLLSEVTIPTEKFSKLSNPLNLGSPTQIAILLYDGLGLKSPDKRKPRGTGEDILEKLIPNEPRLQCILDYREIQKLLSTYVNKIPNEALADGKIHTGFNQYGAKTGRFSSSEPVNLQNIPAKNKDIRKMFVADEGNVLCGGDFSQQEPRILAHISQDDKLIKAYEHNKDVYSTIGSNVFGVSYDDCQEFKADGTKNPAGKERRGKMKVLVLAKMYGMGDRSVSDSLDISLKEAKNIGKTFDELIPGAKQAADDSQNMARQVGYVKTVYGRKRRLPDIQLPEYEITRVGENVDEDEFSYYKGMFDKSWGNEKRSMITQIQSEYGLVIKDNSMKIADAERQALNSRIQGTAADITKKAMVAVGQSQLLKDLGYKMLMCVHDELIGQCPEDNMSEVAIEKERLMINCCTDKISIPMKVDMEISRRWTGESII